MRKTSKKKSIPNELPDYKENTQISLASFKRRPTHFVLRAFKGEVIVVFKNMEDEIPYFLITPWRKKVSIATEIQSEDDH